VAPTGSLIEMDREVIDEAMGTCQDLLPRGGRGRDRTPRTKPFPGLGYRVCGVHARARRRGYPGPRVRRRWRFIQRIDPGIANSDEFRGADEACQSIIEDAHPGGEEGGR
jgi:hypothetical protein